MSSPKKEIILFELPTFPKGPIALSLYAVAAAFGKNVNVRIIDFNIDDLSLWNFSDQNLKKSSLFGLKVSSQNFEIAQHISQKLKEKHPNIPVLWGGELPSLLPEKAIKYCDCIVTGPIEPVAQSLVEDLDKKCLKNRYNGDSSSYPITLNPPPSFDLIPKSNAYYSFMGLPMETSRGCTQKCVFCMVHTMQKNYNLKTDEQIENELKLYENQFINVIDYNIGVDKHHVIRISKLIQKSSASGWMAEMCLENLDDDEMLYYMQESGCRMIYCGLESISEDSLLSINKSKTNHIENYERIIRKVQSYGIQIAAGVILGLKGTKKETFKETFDFFQRMGIIYTKLTTLTYNPGTKVHDSMRKMGTYLTDDIKKFDGNYLSFIAKDVSEDIVKEGAEYYIKNFYNPWNTIKRAFNTSLPLSGKIEFILFSYCYGEVYRSWLKHDVLKQEDKFDNLLKRTIKKNLTFRISEWFISKIRNRNKKYGNKLIDSSNKDTSKSSQVFTHVNINSQL